eukprot:967059_1
MILQRTKEKDSLSSSIHWIQQRNTFEPEMQLNTPSSRFNPFIQQDYHLHRPVLHGASHCAHSSGHFFTPSLVSREEEEELKIFNNNIIQQYDFRQPTLTIETPEPPSYPSYRYDGDSSVCYSMPQNYAYDKSRPSATNVPNQDTKTPYTSISEQILSGFTRILILNDDDDGMYTDSDFEQEEDDLDDEPSQDKSRPSQKK